MRLRDARATRGGVYISVYSSVTVPQCLLQHPLQGGELGAPRRSDPEGPELRADIAAAVAPAFLPFAAVEVGFPELSLALESLHGLFSDDRMIEAPVIALDPAGQSPVADALPFGGIAHGEASQHAVIVRQRAGRDLMPALGPERHRGVT